jgi:hypothetical protein
MAKTRGFGRFPFLSDQVAPESVLRKTPVFEPTYSVEGLDGTTPRNAARSPVYPVDDADQLCPLFTDFQIPPSWATA